MKHPFIKKATPHLLAVGLFTLLTWAYMFPVLQGKCLAQHDSVQSLYMQQEIHDHHEKTGEWSLWTGSMFCGMPAYQIVLYFSNNPFTFVLDFFRTLFPADAELVFLLLLGFYILLYTFTGNAWIAVIGAIAFAFSSFNFISIDAGHTSKVRCIAMIAPVLAGVIAAFRGRYLFGAALVAFSLAFQIRSNHFQITYYTLIAVGFISVYYLVIAVRKKQIADFARSCGMLLIAFLLSLGSNAALLWTTYEYSGETTRGGTSELDSVQSTGLKNDYAFSWSYGKMETFTLLIPNYNGGASNETLDKNSHLGRLYKKMNVPQKEIEKSLKAVPTYWGGQPFTAGPTYFGAIVCFLFVFGMFLVRDPIKWVFFALGIFCILMAWGNNFQTFNSILFNSLPFYNKFRTPSMILSLAGVAFTFVAALGLNELLNGKTEKQKALKYLKYSLYIMAGLILSAGAISWIYFDFNSAGDANLLKAGWPQQALDAIKDDRATMLRADLVRSLAFIALTGALLWLITEQKVKRSYLLILLGALVLFDGWSVCRRYLDQTDFITKAERQKLFQPSKSDLTILQDTGLSYRVLNVTGNPFGESNTACFHKSIGGYHAAKLKRYQDLTEKQIIRNLQNLNTGLTNEQIPVLNMLNMRYIITQNDVVFNAHAMGNAWMVPRYRIADGAKAEMEALTRFNPAREAIVDASYKDYLSGLSTTDPATGSIQLTAYSPDKVNYKTAAQTEQLAVFSEIYYGGDGKGWQAYLDGKPVEHIRANYVLRAMRVPSGEHEIEFRFEPRSYYTGEKIAIATASGTLLLILILLGARLRREFKQ